MVSGVLEGCIDGSVSEWVAKKGLLCVNIKIK